MKLDLIKLDERIGKLQEVRRIASDPEMAAILLEFITTDDEPAKLPAGAKLEAYDAVATPAAHNFSEASEVVKKVVQGIDALPKGDLWSRQRG